MSAERSETYLNPVYPHSFPDPFVLKSKDGYFAYCTGFANGDDEVFRVLGSADLVCWTDRGFAMRPLDTAPPYYWAPEVSYWGGLYYLYYSTGNEVLMEIRVAVSDRPDGGFEDAGRRMTFQDFAIDPHVFTDADGQRYMFYATDFLEHSHIGTGTVVDRLVDPFTLAGTPRPVTRARYDWQVYDANRVEKGGVRWHTVEGPAVLKRKGTYFEMFSGGNWQNTTYGVSFACTQTIETEEEWNQYSDGDKVLPLLRTVPGEVIGPGHNSIVRGPNNRELYCVYHRWTDAGRVMAIDRMDVVGQRLFVRGPTTGPQPAPFKPRVITTDNPPISGQLVATPSSFLLEFSLRCSADRSDADVGFTVNDGETTFSLLHGNRSPGFDASVFHDFSIEVDGRRLVILIDGWFCSATMTLDREVSHLTFYEKNTEAEFARVELTAGYEDRLDDRGSFRARGWLLNGPGSVNALDGEVTLSSPNGETVMSRKMSFEEVDFAANARRSAAGTFGLRLIDDERVSAELAIGDDVRLTAGSREVTRPLPAGWHLDDLHQYEILAGAGRIIAYLEDIELAELPFNDGPVTTAIFCRDGEIAVEMVRATAI